MPYFIDDNNCVRKGTKDEPGETVKCHEEHEQAVAHLKALYVNVEDAEEKGGPSSGWHKPPRGTHNAENAPNFAGGPGADRKFGTESDEPPEGTRRCKCPKCGAVIVLPKGKQCEDIECPSCGGSPQQTEWREDKPAEGRGGRKPKPGRKKSVDEDDEPCPSCEEDKAQETHTCTCPECDKSVHVPLGQKCNEVKCPECKAMMKQSDEQDEQDEQDDENEQKAMDAPGPTVHGEGGSIGDTARVMDDGEGADECTCPKCGKGIPCTAKACPYCKQSIDKVERGGKMDEQEKAEWSTGSVNDLPDSSFLYVESGEKDDEGKTTPRSKRHLPYKDASGKVDLPHLRNALSRLGQSNTGSGDGWLTPELRKRLQSKAESILKEHGGSSSDGEEKSILTIYKSASGDWRWLSISSWAVVDKEAEVVSEQAYRDAIAHAEKSGKWGELDLVHVDGTDIGACDQLFVLKSGDEPAKFGAGGTFYDTAKATRAREAIQADPAYWGMSLKFRFNPQRKVKGVYTGDIQVLKHSILPQHMAASYGTAIAVQGGSMSKALDDKAAAALRQLGHTEDEIAELAQKQKALPQEDNVVEKEDTTPTEAVGTQPATEVTEERKGGTLKQLFQELGKWFNGPDTPVASPDEARKAEEVSESPAEDQTEKGETEAKVKAATEVVAPDAGAMLQALGEAVAKSVGEMVKAELDTRDKRIAELEATVKGLNDSVEEKVEQRLRDLPQVVKVAASQVRATVVDEKPRGLTFGNPPDSMAEYTKALVADITRVVEDKMAGAKFQV